MRAYSRYHGIAILFLISLGLAAAALMPAEAKVNGTLTPQIQESFERRISLDLRDMDLVDVFKFLSLKGDFSVVVSKDVQGRATLVLKDVSIEDAMEIIAIANGVAYQVMENIVYVMPEPEYFQMYGRSFRDKTEVRIMKLQYARPSFVLQTLSDVKSDVGKIVIDEDTGSVILIDTRERLDEMTRVVNEIDREVETKVFTLNYADAEEVKEKLREKLDVKAVGSIEADARTNQIIIAALPKRFDEIEPLVAALDKKTQEVLIKLRILKLTLNPKFDFGIDWQALFSTSQHSALRALQFVGSFPVSSDISAGAIDASTFGTVGQIFTGDFTDFGDVEIDLRALKQISDTKVLANPQILVLDNEEAKIHIGDKLAYVTTTTTGTGADQTTNEEIHFLDVGVLLDVKPEISDNGYVRMSIKPEISSQSGTLETPQGAEVPLVNTTIVETKVMVKDGTTIIIGGLHEDKNSEVRKGLPYLMDIPFIGWLFKNADDDVKRTEIVIFLTPHIVSGGDDITGYRPDMLPPKEY